MMLTLPEESLPMNEMDLMSFDQDPPFGVPESSESAMILVNPEDHRADV